MDVFGKAVERAARERQARAGETPDAPDTVVIPGLRPVQDVQDIEYTETPVKKSWVPATQSINTRERDGQLTPSVHAYNILRTRVVQRLERNGWNLLAVTSPAKGNGKTTTAVNLAISIARAATHSVLLVDLDLRRPSVHHHFGVEPEKGVTDLVSGTAEFQDVVFNPSIARLTVLPGGEKLSHSSEFLSKPQMQKFVEEIRDRYPKRIIVFDMPPVLGGADVLSFLPTVQACLLVLEAGKTTRDELRAATKALTQASMIGTVLNRGIVEQGAYY
jgi:capsular exopolysaccharide synthesis family protein